MFKVKQTRQFFFILIKIESVCKTDHFCLVNNMTQIHNIIQMSVQYFHQLLPLLLLLSSAISEEIHNFDYVNHGSDWPDCVINGTKQSPIQLNETHDPKVNVDSFFIADFSKATANLTFYNTTIYLSSANGFGTTYTKLITNTVASLIASEIRFRIHSEHKVNNNYYDLELQIFHTELYPGRNYKLAIALFFNVSTEADPFLQTIIDTYSQSKQQQKTTEIQVDLSHLFSKYMTQNFWFYAGSLTFPPCKNGLLHWVVYKRPYSMTQSQLNSLVDILKGKQARDSWDGNWRAIQNLNGNKVGFRNMNDQL